MGEFRQFIEAWFRKGTVSSFAPSPEEVKQHQDKEVDDYTAGMTKFKKAIEDFAKDVRNNRDQVIARLTGKYGEREPLYRWSHYYLPRVDYMTNDPAMMEKRNEEIKNIIRTALEWFDTAREGMKEPQTGFDWEHQKKLARDRSNRAAKKGNIPSSIRGPWDYSSKRA